MTKRGKKKIGKKHDEVPQDEERGGKTVVATEQPAGASRQGLTGHTVDLSFFRSSAQLYGELHQRLSRVSGEGYTEESVSQTGRQILRALDELAHAVDPRYESKSPCPFVMLLSMLLPTLRKYLAWTQATRSLWGSNFIVLRHQSITSEATVYRGEADTVLWAMLAQHNILTRFALQTAHILHLIDCSEGVDHDDAYPKRTIHQSKAHQSTSQASSASSYSSVTSTPRDPMDSSRVHTLRASSDKPVSIPQIYRISVELANVDAECKIHLAKLTESLVEVVEMIAKHMCAATASKDAGKARISAREFIERLVQHLLEPMGQRMLAKPSAAFIDLFPQLLEQCITVTIDKFARSNENRNELQAAPFEAGVMHLRTWSFKLEIEYNTLLRSLSNSSNNTDSNTDTGASDTGTLSIAYTPNKRLDLMGLGGFKRLETTLSSWLNAASSTPAGSDLGSGTSARSWGLTSLAGGLRSTLVRTFSGRTGSPM
ncbi:hypothetical protein JG688_00007413 [Phytophthora aleatoria]|uniref:Uncharacterized protein n=1 Tax=Phytophthora aleatoria TaxID=2496075 RepID=A0A8J5IJZ2_9STRA|nr:hypothetical protein JG688_00007413 [Phytophthora aleatoria]